MTNPDPRIHVFRFGLRGWAAIGVAIIVLGAITVLALGLFLFLLPVLLLAPILYYFLPRPKMYPEKRLQPSLMENSALWAPGRLKEKRMAEMPNNPLRASALLATALLVTPAGAAEKASLCKPASVEKGNQIQLSGTLYGESHFGPPGYGEHPKTDRKDRIAILRLDTPMRVDLPLTDFHAAGIITVKDVQIVPARPGALDSAGLSGKHVVITGQLFEPNGDDHVRDILIFADSGRTGGKIACNGSEPPPGK